MKKRIFSLLLALAMVLSLMPVGALAATEPAYYDTVKADGTIERGGGQMWADLYIETSSDSVTWGEVSYVIKNDVTINGDLTINARSSFARVLLCDGAKLTINGALKFAQGTRPLYVYGQTVQNTGEVGTLVINHTGSGAAIQSESTNGSTLSIHGGTLEINSASGDLVKNITLEVQNSYLGTSSCTVMKATRTDASGHSEELKHGDWAGLAPAETDLKGSKLVIEYCGHRADDATYTHNEGTDTHTETCTVCGFAQTVECGLYAVSVTDTMHTMGCYRCDNRHAAESHTPDTENTNYVVTADGKGHSNSVCRVCTYSFGDSEAHTYDDTTNGSCDKCGFLPILEGAKGEDGTGNLYEDLETAFEAGETELTLVSHATNEYQGIWRYAFVLDSSDKPVTLKTNGLKLVSFGYDPALTVNGGSLIIEGAAVLEGENGGAGNPATSAIKVTGGNLTFNDTVNATGGAKNSSAAPAIEVIGGTVTFAQDVTATAVENEGLDTAIAPAIEVTGGKVIFNDKVTATGGLGGTPKNKRPCEPAIKATGGELEFNSDLDLNGGLTITGDAKLTKGLTRGTFKVAYTGETVDGYAVSVVGSANYKNLNSLLAADRAFVSEDETRKYPCVGDNNRSWGGDVTIQEHTHVYNPAENYTCECGVTCDHSAGYENGRCKTCKMPCPHRRLGIGDRDCLDCGQRMIARIITKNNEGYDLPTYYSDLPTALNAAKNGETVTLLDNIDQSSKTACLTGDNKTVTLNLNGKNITGGWIYVGIDQNGKVINSSRLNITGSGSFDGMIGISAKGTLDLSGWDGGTIRTVSSSQNGSDESTLISGENKGTINTLSFYSWPSDKISKTKLTGGTYGSIPITMNSDGYILFSDLLAPGYAFQYADGSGSFVNYATKATYDEAGVISDVKVVKCTSHEDADSDSHCDYCNTALDGMAASVTTAGTNAKTYYFSDLAAAFDAVADAAADGATVRLLKNVALGETLRVYGQVTLDLNGFTIDGSTATDGTIILSVTYGGILTICDSSSTGKPGAITNSSNGWSVNPMGTLNITGGTFGSVYLSNASTVSGGTFYYLACSGRPLGDALAKGYAFAQKDGPNNALVNAYGTDGNPVTFLFNVTVVEHTEHSGSPCACGYVCDHGDGMDPANGQCKTCGSLLAVASVTAAGEDPAIAYYTDIHDAFTAAAASSDSTLTLLQNVTLEDDKDINISSPYEDCTFTVDWNGFTLSGNTWKNLLTFSGRIYVTLKDSRGSNTGGVCNNYAPFTSKGGIAVCISLFNGYCVTIEGGTYSAQVRKLYKTGSLQIKGGVFENPANAPVKFALYALEEGSKLADLLIPGYTFAYDADGTDLLDVYETARTDAGRTVHVVSHTHGNFGNNDKCACGYTCLHAAVDNDNKCTVCGKTMVASVTQGETTTYYKALSDAIRAARLGGTLTLLADAPQNEEPSISSNLTLDLNGFNIPKLRLGAKITLKDSGTTNKGVIGTLTINGSDTSIVLGDLMTGGDSLKSNDTWLTAAELLGRTASNVSVHQTDLDSVTANGPESVTYGETGKGFIVLTVAPNNLTSYTEHWFELKDGAWTQITGAGGTSYPPAALDAGPHMIRSAVKSGGGWVLSNAVTVTVNPASIEGANITLDHPSFVYDGAEKTPAVSSVTLNLTTLTKDTDYTVEVTGQTNAGSDYTLTVTGEGNYTGEVEVKWSITPKPVTNPTINVASCVYNGSAQTPTVELTDGSTVIPASEYTVEYSNNTNAGTATVTIHDAAGGNYTVSGSTTFKIEKATVSAPAAAELTVYNGLDKTYLVELPALPELESPKAYGETTYTVKSVALGNYYTGDALIKKGKLTLPINAVTTDQEGKIGEVTVTVTTTNYTDITLTVNVSAANKIVPAAANVSATAITYGQPLSSSAITGTMKDPTTGAAVEGDFAWTDAQYTYKPDAGSYKAEWKFTPSGSNSYMYAATTEKVTVTVNKATMTATVTQHTALTYNGKAQTADVDISVTTADKTTIPAFTYAATENGSYGSDIPTFIDAGEHKVYFRATDPKGNHEVFSGSFTVTIDPKTVTAPTIELTGDRTYTGAEIKPTVTVKDGSAVIPANEYTVEYSGNTNAGTATVTIYDVAGGNYIVSGHTTFEIVKAASDVTAAPAANSLTYNGTAQTLLTPGTATGGTMVYRLGENGDFSAQIPSATNAGGYTVYYKVAGDANHNDTDPQSVTVTIGKAAVTVTAESKSSRVGKDLQPLTFTYAPELFAEDAFNGALATTADKDTVKDYPITQGSLTLGDNYQITFIAGTYSVLAKLPQASFRFAESAVEKTYGDGDFTLAATGEAENSAVTYSSSDETIATVDAAGTVQIHKAGTVTITAVASETAEHLEGRVSYTLTVARKSVIITVLDKRAYTDSAAPDLSTPVLGTDYTVDGLLGGDTLRTGPTLTYDPAVPDMRKAGTAAKIVASDADAGENYQFTYVSGTLTLISRANPVGPSEPSVNPGEPDNGSVTVSPKNPAKGSTVIITVEPDEGYALDEIAVTDKDGNALKLTDKGNGKYSFTMPSGKVDIDASFKKLAETSPFDDVSTNAYYYEAVKWAAENNITGGIGNGLFGPELTCSRGQIVTFLWRAAGSPEPKALSTFTDVAADAYYAKAVAWAVENGVTTGAGDGKFSPDAPCTRGQAVTFLWRALGQLTGDKASFSDVPADSYFAQAVAWAAANGVTTGVGNNLFAPGGDCTRAQIVTFLWRAYRQN